MFGYVSPTACSLLEEFADVPNLELLYIINGGVVSAISKLV
jgi:hypothetical protein